MLDPSIKILFQGMIIKGYWRGIYLIRRSAIGGDQDFKQSSDFALLIKNWLVCHKFNIFLMDSLPYF